VEYAPSTSVVGPVRKRTPKSPPAGNQSNKDKTEPPTEKNGVLTIWGIVKQNAPKKSETVKKPQTKSLRQSGEASDKDDPTRLDNGDNAIANADSLTQMFALGFGTSNQQLSGLEGLGLDGDTDPLASLFSGNAIRSTFQSTGLQRKETSLRLDASGNFEMEEAMPAGEDFQDMQALLEGRTTEMFNFSDGVQIQPYANAYKKTPVTRWTESQTNRFFKALEMFGADLMVVRALLPEFNDRQIREKFKTEERRNPEKVDKAISTRNDVPHEDIVEAFEKVHGKQIDSSTHYRADEDSNSDDEPIFHTRVEPTVEQGQSAVDKMLSSGGGLLSLFDDADGVGNSVVETGNYSEDLLDMLL